MVFKISHIILGKTQLVFKKHGFKKVTRILKVINSLNQLENRKVIWEKKIIFTLKFRIKTKNNLILMLLKCKRTKIKLKGFLNLSHLFITSFQGKFYN